MRPFDPRLLRHAPRARAGVAATVVLGAARAVLAVAQALLLAHLLATGFTGSGAGALRGPLLALAGVVGLRAVAAAAQDVVSRRLSAAVKEQLRARVLGRLAALGPGWLAGRRSGELATLLGSGVEAMDGWFRLYLPQLVLAALVPGAVVVVLLATDWRSGLVVALTLPLLPVFLALVGLHTKARTEQQWAQLGRLGGHFLDVVTGLPTLRSFGRAQAQVAVLRRITDEHRTATLAALRTAFLSALVLELAATLSVAVVAVSVGFRLLAGDLGLEPALAVLLLAPEAFLPLRAVGTAFHAAMDGVTAAEQSFAVLEEPLPPQAQGRRPVAPGPLRLAGVTVEHPGRPAAVRDLDLEVAVGERVVLVGPSGSGKSTVLALLLGLVQPTAGRVLVGGVDLREADLDAWRAQVAWVPQAPHLFAGTVADNIRLGRPDATDAQVRAAARAAHAEEFVDELPDGLATVLGEGGAGLSVGQQRRVAVARAFLRDAPVVLLDEPTAGLDSRSEAVVADAVERLCAGRTVLLATHRREVLRPGDRVVDLGGALLPAGRT